jgi:hypothetical protein
MLINSKCIYLDISEIKSLKLQSEIVKNMKIKLLLLIIYLSNRANSSEV